MLKGVIFAIFGVAIAALVATPAGADDIATRVQMCVACHGEHGAPVNAATPIIWGQQANYLYKELHDYHSGARSNAIMSPIVKSFSLQELRKTADYFAAKPWPAASRAAGIGSPPEGIVMCKACHGQNFKGGQPAPRLAGLSYNYLIGAMHSFADGTRTNNLDMPGFMKTMSDSERKAIAKYLSSL